MGTRRGAIFGSKEKEGCAVRGKIARAPAVKFDRHVENWRKLFIDFLSLSYPSTLQQNNDTSKEVQRRPVQTKKIAGRVPLFGNELIRRKKKRSSRFINFRGRGLGKKTK